MNYLLDTHVLLWSFLDTGKLSPKIKTILLSYENEIFYSPVSLWEISIKYGLKKMTLNGGTPEDFFEELDSSYYLCKTLENADFATCYRLPVYHKDPFDRLLIWQAIRSGFTLISADKSMEAYKTEGLEAVCL